MIHMCHVSVTILDYVFVANAVHSVIIHFHVCSFKSNKISKADVHCLKKCWENIG